MARNRGHANDIGDINRLVDEDRWIDWSGRIARPGSMGPIVDDQNDSIA